MSSDAWADVHAQAIMSASVGNTAQSLCKLIDAAQHQQSALPCNASHRHALLYRPYLNCSFRGMQLCLAQLVYQALGRKGTGFGMQIAQHIITGAGAGTECTSGTGQAWLTASSKTRV